jgi:ABC-type multidrug transport system ATPase subunit
VADTLRGLAQVPSDPEILLLDEPTSGLDFERTNELYNWLNVIHDAGKTIFFTSHRPEEIKNLATRFMVLHQGRLIFDGSPQSYFQSGGRRQFLEH